MVDAVHLTAERERLSRLEGVDVSELIGHREGHGSRVIGEPLHGGDT